MEPRRALGTAGEIQAKAWLEAHGLLCLAQNWRPSASSRLRGELDLVMVQPDGVLVIVEVRTSAAGFGGGAAWSITPSKQQRLSQLGLAFASTLERPPKAIRFDLLAITLQNQTFHLHWLKHALSFESLPFD